MGWSEIRSWIVKSSEEDSREVAFRSAARAVTQLANDIGPTQSSGEAKEVASLAIMRGLMTARVALDRSDVDALTAAWAASNALLKHNNTFSYVVRAVMYTLKSFIPEEGIGRVEGLRRAFQAVYDLTQNVDRWEGVSRASEAIDTWMVAEREFDAIAKGITLGPPLDPNDATGRRWKNYESHLKAFDDTWEIWIVWLRFRLFGLSNDEIPYTVWPRIERSLALRDEEFWRQPVGTVNARFTELVIEAVDRILDEEAERQQNKLGLTFYVENGRSIDIAPRSDQAESNIIASVVKEVRRNALELADSCEGNSTAHLKVRVLEYLEVIEGARWTDDMLLIMRGDSLRKESEFQSSRDDDSDIAPFPQSTMRALEQTIRSHNMLVNSHAALSELDKMLLGPDGGGDTKPVQNLRTLVSMAEARSVISERAAKALEDAASHIENAKMATRSVKRDQLSFDNYLRTVVGFLWRNKAAISASGTGAAGMAYGLSHWAIANQAILMAYFQQNPIMTLLLKRLFSFLSHMPVL